MAIKIAHFSIDENGKARGGAAGDQTGKECCVRTWYNKPWDYYIEITDETLANKAADIFTQVANRNEAGYDQGQRLTFYDALVDCKGDITKLKPCEADCSSGVSSIYKFLGLNISHSCTTRNIRAALESTGKVKVYSDAEHTTSDKYAKRGGLYLKEGSHVVMAVENGSAVTAQKAPTQTSTSTSASTKAECKDGDVIKLKKDAKYYNGKTIPAWVFNKTLYYRGKNSNGIIFSTLKTGAITGVVKPESIEGAATEQKTPTPTNASTFTPYMVKVTASALNYRKGPGTNYGINGVIRDQGTYTIVEEQNGWGRLKSGAGWISLAYTRRV